MLRNVIGWGGGSNFRGKSDTKVYASTLLALRGSGGGVKFSGKTITSHFNGPLSKLNIWLLGQILSCDNAIPPMHTIDNHFFTFVIN